ncbi:UDP-N-acetylmuramoyl-L-alanyl-D-glutamate--2,6-diaminopimelate ligase [Patescibacteria group bacterium]|nr:UDP-N-acetylmuramoyl-L-alanyl-D-glutamate--2,6-diaminopimelate ligase [Patescibacteria group bacterium]
MIKIIKKILRPVLYSMPWLYDIYHHSQGMLAATLYGFPTMKMRVIGITGTNGKTTTANILAHILETSGAKVGMATTVNVWTGTKKWINETKMTTLSPFALQGLLRQMANNKCRYALVETTSHALAQHRTWGIFYDMAIFTNITHDHLDYHKTFENYRTAKAKLFRELADSLRKPGMPKISVVNISDPNSEHFIKYPADQKYLYGIDLLTTPATPDITIYANNVHEGRQHTYFTLNTPKGSIDIKLRLLGKFNIYNTLAAASAAYALDIDIQTIQQGIESLWQVPGRMEYVPNDKNLDIIIDYAHTPDGFQKVFEALRPLARGKIIAVFGAAGDRDKTKRPILGQIASQFADEIILTEEDPGSENPGTIINQIMTGIDTTKFASGKNMHIILDRKSAVQRALTHAKPNDTILLLAMGAQTVLARKDKKIPYSEREVVQQILKTMS